MHPCTHPFTYPSIHPSPINFPFKNTSSVYQVPGIGNTGCSKPEFVQTLVEFTVHLYEWSFLWWDEISDTHKLKEKRLILVLSFRGSLGDWLVPGGKSRAGESCSSRGSPEAKGEGAEAETNPPDAAPMTPFLRLSSTSQLPTVL